MGVMGLETRPYIRRQVLSATSIYESKSSRERDSAALCISLPLSALMASYKSSKMHYNSNETANSDGPGDCIVEPLLASVPG